MKIERNGRKIDLTYDELVCAAKEYELDVMKSNVKDTISCFLFEFPAVTSFDENDIAEIAMQAQRYFARNDDVGEIREMVIKDTISNYVLDNWLCVETQDFLEYNNKGIYVIDSHICNDFVQGKVLRVFVIDDAKAFDLKMIALNEDGDIVFRRIGD